MVRHGDFIGSLRRGRFTPSDHGYQVRLERVGRPGCLSGAMLVKSYQLRLRGSQTKVRSLGLAS